MCVMSMVMDFYNDKWEEKFKNIRLHPLNLEPPITDEEINEFRQLLERAHEYDKKHNEPNCEMEEKKEKIRKLAQELGVKVDFIE